MKTLKAEGLHIFRINNGVTRIHSSSGLSGKPVWSTLSMPSKIADVVIEDSIHTTAAIASDCVTSLLNINLACAAPKPQHSHNSRCWSPKHTKLNFQNLKNTDQIGHCNLLKANEMVCKWHALSSREETTIYLIIYQLIPWASRIKLSSMRIVVLAASPTEDPDSGYY